MWVLTRAQADALNNQQVLVENGLIAPLAEYLKGRRSPFISADGIVNLVPLAALHDGEHFLLDTFDALTYLSSGRDLLPRQPATALGPVAVFADPDFGAPPDDLEGAEPGTERPGALAQQIHGLRSLPATRDEAHLLQSLFPGARLRQGRSATDRALLSVVRPRLLHVATHGVFLGEDDGAALPAVATRAARHRELAFSWEETAPAQTAAWEDRKSVV